MAPQIFTPRLFKYEEPRHKNGRKLCVDNPKQKDISYELRQLLMDMAVETNRPLKMVAQIRRKYTERKTQKMDIADQGQTSLQYVVS